MKKFFIYELKKSLLVMGAFAVIAAAIYVVTVLVNAEWLSRSHGDFPFEAILIPGSAICVITPIWKLSYRMKKRSVDMYYSLPLSHTRILAVKYLVGLIAVFAPYTVAYWIGSFTAMGAVGKTLNAVYFIWTYLATIIPMAVIYSLAAFIFTRANRLIDGILFTVMTGMALGIVAEVVSTFIVEVPYYFYVDSQYYLNSIYYTPFSSLNAVSLYFKTYIFKNVTFSLRLGPQDIIGMVLITVLGAASVVGLFLSERYAKAENCEQLSNSFFGYRVMIPLYTFAFAFLSAILSYVLVALVAAAAYAVSILYKRTPKICWKFAVIVAAAFIAGFALSFAAKAVIDHYIKMYYGFSGYYYSLMPHSFL